MKAVSAGSGRATPAAATFATISRKGAAIAARIADFRTEKKMAAEAARAAGRAGTIAAADP